MRNTTTNLTSSSSSGNVQASKKLTIKNLKGLLFLSHRSCPSKNNNNNNNNKHTTKKEIPKIRDEFFKKLWPSLEEAVRAIHDNRKIETSLEILYQYVENLCAEGFSSHLYASLKKVCEEHIVRDLPQLVASMNDPIEYLKLLNTHWLNHTAHMTMICQIFLALDRGYVLNNPLIMSIWDMSLELYKSYVATDRVVQARCINGVLSLIERERSGEWVDRGLVKSLLSMLHKMQLYQSTFELAFIRASEKLYACEGEQLLHVLDVPDYLKHVEKRFGEEASRQSHYLHGSTRDSLVHCLEKHLIGEHVAAILHKGLDQMLDEHRLPDLKLLYQLIARVLNGVEQLKTAYSQYIKKRGREIVINPEKDNVMIQELIDFKEKLDVTSECWSNNEKFTHALKDSFEHFINQRSNKPAELIAKYIDNKLRVGNKEATEEELDKILDKIMVLFRFIHGKDVFEAFYKKDLAKRLLIGKSASVDAEKSMLSKLKQECGGVFTLKLEGMFKDMELSKDIMAAYDQVI